MHIMRIYETHAHMCIVCECTHTYNTHNFIRHNAQQRTCVSAHYAHLRIKYASSAHMRRCATSALMHMCVSYAHAYYAFVHAALGHAALVHARIVIQGAAAAAAGRGSPPPPRRVVALWVRSGWKMFDL